MMQKVPIVRMALCQWKPFIILDVRVAMGGGLLEMLQKSDSLGSALGVETSK